MRNTTKTTKTNSLRKEDFKMIFNVVSKNITIEDENHIVYGIQRGNIRYDNLSSNYKEVKSFVDTLNRVGDISDCHIEDMVNDFLTEKSEINCGKRKEDKDMRFIVKHNVVIKNNEAFDTFGIESEDNKVVIPDFTTDYDDALWFQKYLSDNNIISEDEVNILVDKFFFEAYEKSAK